MKKIIINSDGRNMGWGGFQALNVAVTVTLNHIHSISWARCGLQLSGLICSLIAKMSFLI